MSLLADLFSTIDKRSLGEVATTLGEPDKSVSDGMRSAVAALLGGMASKSGNPNLLRQILALAPPATEGVTWSNAAGAIADPTSPAMSIGRRILSTLFGDSEGLVTRALGAGTGLPTSKMTSLMAMAAPMVMSFLGKRVRDGGMNLASFGSMLQQETPAIRSALPHGVNELLWPHERETIPVSPVVAQTTVAAQRSRVWLLPLLLLIPAFLWLTHHARRPVVEIPSAAPFGTANRAMPENPLAIPKPSPVKNVDLYFKSGTMMLRPDSQVKLRAFAAALAADPSTHVIVNGYTDNVGNPAANMRVSQERADAIKADLIGMGISADRLSAQGFGGENPIADNTTPEGRESNRRVSVAIGER